MKKGRHRKKIGMTILMSHRADFKAKNGTMTKWDTPQLEKINSLGRHNSHNDVCLQE